MAAKEEKPTKIGGYKPTQELGHGAMGNLWLCHDPSMDRMVVVKQMQDGLEANEGNVRRFLQEAYILAHLNHPAIITPHALWKEKDGKYSISMEFVHGKTLRQVLDKCPKPPLWLVMSVLYSVLGALGHAHRNGIIHRDLKPSNIMIDKDGRVRLLDFGIARNENSVKLLKDDETDQRITAENAILGTVTYMSPEQTMGAEATPASDLFALGVIACEMLLGENVFRGENFRDTASRIQRLRITPKAFSKDVPQGLVKFVLKLVNKKPKDRPLTANDAADQLSVLMKEYPRDLDPYMSMFLSALRQRDEHPDEALDYPAPPTYKTSPSKFILAGFAMGAIFATIATVLKFLYF